ncbi:uncharacterized protein L969DRAFT_92928 [Mixia osmundae IAM 14324]|uniref:Major facilitator superfamily (MFS) profile domain-containing protein n=1 Tax=Mixia osmundae (strain CBS 9802 / IAM 14324 / JCM 22182 / KY 12970) TaxID=764103 RepID=G7DTT0_MIXOS|nr:uncharacterized protein L969DRAFT_92928 [Mixia osmundae IAM 14324]KEI41705.1 hypothetical protein L969DRAFT_92928 [Mixia osmundae IAM 14324]GAA93990.1 hypothetical protein E5Q_00637 [Mixia osmundae IAM 14324]
MNTDFSAPGEKQWNAEQERTNDAGTMKQDLSDKDGQNERAQTKLDSLGEKDPEKFGGQVTVEDDASAERARDNGVDEIFLYKVGLINSTMSQIGWGAYHYKLFMLCSLGFLNDNIWLQGVAIILPQITRELSPPGGHVAFVTLSLYVGLILGASLWGVSADIVGRRLSFNITLGLSGVFGLAAGASPNFVALCSLIACTGFGVGGSLPVDSTFFLDQVPAAQQWTLVLMSLWWSVGQLIASLIAWVFIVNFSCPDNVPCTNQNNQGWRYTLYTLGALTTAMFLVRFLVFKVQESPKYLIARGRDQEALDVMHTIAKANGKEISLTLRDLQLRSPDSDMSEIKYTNKELVKRALAEVSLAHVKPLFSTTKLAINFTLLMWLWLAIGIAYPLYNAFLPTFLAQKAASASAATSVNTTYKNYAIISTSGIPGSLFASWLVERTRSGGKFSLGGRKLALAVSTVAVGVFLFIFTIATTNSAVLGINYAAGFFQNSMYGILYCVSPESIPSPNRGTAEAILSSLNRIGGLQAPIIATYAGLTTSIPLYVSASLFVISGIVACFLRETAGKAAL